jgi:hypothetical protein
MRALILVPLCFWWSLHYGKSMLPTNDIYQSVNSILHIGDICQNIKTVFHIDDIYQMNIFITRTLQQLVPSHDQKFETQTDKIGLLSSSIDRLADDFSTMSKNMDQKLEKLIVKTEEISIRPDPNWKEVDDMIYLLKKEGGKMSVTLHRCHQLSQKIGDDLVDNKRRLLKSFDIYK